MAASLALVGAAAPAMASTNISDSQTGVSIATASTYLNTTGNFLIHTPIGDIGPSISAGNVSMTTDGNGNITATTFKPVSMPDKTYTNATKTISLTLTNTQMTVKSRAASGTLTPSGATLNETGMEVDLSGSLCANADGFNYCDNFMPGDPLRIFVAPTTDGGNPGTAVVTASGVAQPNGSYDLTGAGYVTVDTSTWTGWLIGKMMDNSQLILNLNMAPQTATVAADLRKS